MKILLRSLKGLGYIGSEAGTLLSTRQGAKLSFKIQRVKDKGSFIG
jgi:hypothetical protein